MNKLKYCLTDLFAVLIILFFAWQTGSSEGRYLAKQDIGTIFMSISVLWLIFAFFRIASDGVSWFTSLLSALGLFIFGVTLHKVGFCSAITVVGCYLFVVAGLLAPFARRGIIISLFFIALISVITSSLLYAPCEGTVLAEPTEKYQPKVDYDKPIDHPEAKWSLQIEYIGYGSQIYSTTLGFFTGTEQDANKEVRKLAEDWQKTHPKNGIVKFCTVSTYIPPEWKKENRW